MFPREQGSKTLAHNEQDPRCTQADAAAIDESVVCEVCASQVTREQAAASFNLRTLGS